ncbi:hypothetical protein TcBrA4_0099580 [Trypanosoma cruzi]|nr:hypothetical protein TcBrA4_0099580 [Trypanosoma cruzi]
MGISPDHIRAPHAEHRVFARDTVSCSGVGVFRPRHAKDALDGVRRSALEAACNPLGPYDAGRWTDSSSSWTMHLDPLHCHLTPRTAELPVGPRRTAAGSLACTCRAECPVTEHGLGQFPVPRLAAAASQSPTRVPVATDSLSAMESLRLGLLAVHDDVSEEICTVPHSLVRRGHTAGVTFFPRDAAVFHAVRPLTNKPRLHDSSRRTASMSGTWTSSLQWSDGTGRMPRRKRKARPPRDRRLSVWRGLCSWC